MDRKDLLINLVKIISTIVALLVFYFKFVKGSDIKIVKRKYLDSDRHGLYKISFCNKGSKDGLINSLKLQLNGEEGDILNERKTSFDYPIVLSANAYLTCILNVDNLLQDCKSDIFHSIFFFFKKKKCYKVILSYNVISKNKIKPLRYVFYILRDIPS